MCLELGDVVNDLLDGGDTGGFLFGDFAVEFFFNGHDEFHSVQTVGTKVIHKGGAGNNLLGVAAQLGDDDLLDLVFDAKQGGGGTARPGSGTRCWTPTLRTIRPAGSGWPAAERMLPLTSGSSIP